MLGLSVLFAIKEAIRAFREQEQNITGHFRLDSPATAQAVRALCDGLKEV